MAQAPATPNPNPTNQTRQSRIQPQQTNPSKSEFKSKPDNPAHPHKPSKPIPASQTRRPSPNNPRFKPKQTRPHSRPKPGTPRSEPKPKPGSHESEPKPKADGPRSYIPISQPQDAAATPQSPPRQQTNPKPPRTTFQSTSRAPQSPATIRQIVPRQRRIQRNRTSRFSGTNHSDAHRKRSPMCLVR